MTGNPLKCGCDVKWILNSNFQWENLLKGATCTNGKTLPEVLLRDLGILSRIVSEGERYGIGESLPLRHLSPLLLRVRSPIDNGKWRTSIS